MPEVLEYGLIGLPAFVLVISFIVVIHELGHYLAGRWFGVHAEVFSIGFGPTLFSWRDGAGTAWRVAALPLGGYVRFRGDANAASAPDFDTLERLRDEHDAPETVFHFKPVWQRAIIVAAGPLANMILAVAVFTLLSAGRTVIEVPAVVHAVMPDGAAAEAGILPGDRIVEINGRQIDNLADVQSAVVLHADSELDIVVDRAGERLQLSAAPRPVETQQGTCEPVRTGMLGVQASTESAVTRRIGWLEAPAAGVAQTWDTTTMILGYLGRVVTLQTSAEHLSGPVGIFKTATCVTRDSLNEENAGAGAGAPERAMNAGLNLLLLAGMLSVALGLMNILPIPVLDGGHLVYYAYEVVARRPPGPRLQAAGFWVGMSLILGILVIATANDLS